MRAKLILTVGLVISLSAQADVSLYPLPTGGRDVLWISGQINAGDPAALQKYLPLQQTKIIKIIWLDSPGGDVRAAMELGRILRRMDAFAIVYTGKLCASACVLVLAGAADRKVDGKVGIHRPYQPNDKFATPEEQKRFYLKIETEVKEYLREMNVNPSLYDDMIRISPGNIKILNDDEIERYGLSGEDPYIEEARTTQEANSLRISKLELLQRLARAEKDCEQYNNRGASKEYGACYVATTYGISIDEYKHRAARAERECGVTRSIERTICFEKVTRGF